MDNGHCRLVYRSHSLISHDDRAALHRILRESIRNNKRDQITGCLALPDGKFVQVVEGRRDKIGALMERVRSDKRHEDVTVLGEWDTKGRLFQGWSMALPDTTPLGEQSFKIITEDGSGSQVVGLLLDLVTRDENMFFSI